MKKTILISGATGNLGTEVVNEFVKAGYYVIGTARGNSSAATEESVYYHSVDLRDENGSRQFIEEMVSRYQRIEAAALLAGGFAMGDLSSTSLTEIEAMMNINFKTAYSIIRPLFAHMKKAGGGTIILMSSKLGVNPSLGGGALAYTLSKSLIQSFADILNEEGKSHNIAVHVVAPGTIDTALNRAAMPTADFSTWVKASTLANKMVELCDQKFSATSARLHTFF
jgi:NAD(P)-dependent dehydrogenase (short-subunit alcohol dehydrogenase family)